MKLVFCDVDEVVLHYFSYLKDLLDPQLYVLEPFDHDLKIKDAYSGQWLEQEESDFVSDEILSSVIGEQSAIDGAVECLRRIAKHNKIVFLTNVREHLLSKRKQRLAQLGLPFQVVANTGGKGRSISKFVDEAQPRDVAFIDDSIRQLSNVFKHAPRAKLIRANLTLETQSTASDHQFLEARTWPEILTSLEALEF